MAGPTGSGVDHDDLLADEAEGLEDEPTTAPGTEGFKVAVEMPDQLTIRLLEAQALDAYEVWGRAAAVALAFCAAFLGGAIQGGPYRLVCAIVAGVCGVLLVIFWNAFSNTRREMRKKSRTVRYQVSRSASHVPARPGEETPSTSGGGRNLIQNGSFEEGDEWPAKWRRVGPAAGTGATGERTAENHRSASHALRFSSPRPCVNDAGDPQDWVVYGGLSEPIGVVRGDLLTACAWVHVPEDIGQTARGAILDLVGYDHQGQEVPGWGRMDSEDGRLQATDEWHQLLVQRVVNDVRVDRVLLRVALCGVGTCYFDDVALTLAETTS